MLPGAPNTRLAGPCAPCLLNSTLSLRPAPTQAARARNRVLGDNLNEGLLTQLQAMLEQNNHLVQQIQTAREIDDGSEQFRIVLDAERGAWLGASGWLAGWVPAGRAWLAGGLLGVPGWLGGACWARLPGWRAHLCTWPSHLCRACRPGPRAGHLHQKHCVH